ncbi:MAG TPA: glycoside hydrolase family 44 protein [Fibrobacteria bacterium]|nr:glycoside hydrolase family 44 protein [Fibrobacteria bacterium]
MKVLAYSLLFSVAPMAHASVSIGIQADSGRIPISPWIYGKNGSNVSDNPSHPSTDSALAIPREAGLRMTRENAGNNCTKYNWRKKLSSHPDWYNNVYPHDWDFAAKELQSKLPGVQGMFGFQLLGWVASSTAHNFDDWGYNQAQYWEGTTQNLAGGGTPNASGGRASQEGDANQYLEPWPADSTAAILGHWFGPGGLGLDSTAFRYWNMDNEIEIWDGTHDDVDTLLTGRLLKAEDAVKRWIAVAKAARKLFPGIKLVGPASASEWQWYTWPKEATVSYKGASYCWPEYLIKRLSEAQDSSGVRMLDVYDVHLYLSGDTKEQVQNQYRLYWDTTYLDPFANGLRLVNGGWSPDERHQMFFHRIEGWLDKHFGKGHGIKVGASESAIKSVVSNYPSETAVWYASMLGTFADHGGEFYTPWDWNTGMWEVLHLFSRYAKTVRVRSTSSLDSLVSAYSSVTPKNDSMTVILVNRDGTASQDVTVKLEGFTPANKGVTLQLADLNGETFHSRTQNALKKGEVNIADGRFTLSVPKYSVTAVTFASQPQVVGMTRPLEKAARLEVYRDRVIGEAGRRLELIDVRGNSLRAGIGEVSLRDLPRGIVFVRGQGKMRAVPIP